MSTKAGVWIDHRQATIVLLSESAQEVKRIESGMEQHVRSSGGSGSRSANSSQSSVPQDIIEHRFANVLNVYYKEVILVLKNANQILVMAPGKARTEFEKRIHDRRVRTRIAGSENYHKMMELQIAAKVREFFHATSVH